jgi:hypothetical protein
VIQAIWAAITKEEIWLRQWPGPPRVIPAIAQTRTQHPVAGPDGSGTKRHRIGEEHAGSKTQAVPHPIPGTEKRLKPAERRGTGGPWKTQENQNQVSLRFPTALGNRYAIPAFSPAPITATPSRKIPTKTKERSPRFALADFYPFRLILRLENAEEDRAGKCFARVFNNFPSFMSPASHY